MAAKDCSAGLEGRLGRSSVAAFAIHLAGAGVTYLAQLVIARTVGAGSYGIYAYVFAWVTVLSYCCALGFDISLLRFLPLYRSQQSWGLLRGAIRYAERSAVAAGLCIVLIGSAIVTARGSAMSPELANTFLAGLLVVPVTALLWIRGSIVRTFGGVVSALAPDRMVRDGMLLCVIGLAGWGGWWRLHAPFVMAATLAGSVVGLTLVSVAAYQRRREVVRDVRPEYAGPIWRRTALPLVLITVGEVVLNRTGVMLLGASGHTTDAGIYSLAFAITFIVMLPRTAANALFAPMIADRHARHDREGLQALVTKAAAGTCLASICIALPLALMAGPLLGWFGRDFGDGLGAVRVLILGQVIIGFAGSQLYVMTMTGHERDAAVLLVCSVIGNAILAGLLISRFGLIGAAIATTTTFVLWNVAMGVYLWRKLHLLPGLLGLCSHTPGTGWAMRPESFAGMRRVARWLGGAAVVLALSAPAVSRADDLSHAKVVATPAMAEPGYLKRAIDPAFGTPFVRVTDPRRHLLPGVTCGPRYCTHRYSSAQAWSADQRLLVIVNGCHKRCALFLDGHSYKPLFSRTIPGECEWHPTVAELMICVAGNRIYTWTPRTNVKTVVYVARGYAHLQFGPYKGNPSRDGSRLVVRGRTGSHALVAFAYDIKAHKKYRDIQLGTLAGVNGDCTISPSAEYIYCSQDLPDGNRQEYVFTVNGVQVQHWLENDRPSHGDLTIDSDGSDVYIGISKADPDKYHVIKRRLKDGVVTDLLQYGEGQHASLRNIDRPGWVFITFSGSYAEIVAHPYWIPFYQEIIALRIDGSGEIRRIVQTRDAKADYWSEAHGSPSPDGSQVIWSSNWDKPGAPVSDFVASVQWHR